MLERPGALMTTAALNVAGGAAGYMPPLDSIAGAVAAFSLRKLRTAYAGNAVNVRRSSDSTTQDIGFSGNDFNVAAFRAFVGAGSGAVAKWYDQSGNARDATQSAFSDQPVVALAATPTGQPALASAANMGMNANIPAATIPLTLSAVVTRTGALTSYANFFTVFGASTPPALLYQNSPGIILGNAGLDGITVVCADNQFHSVVGVMNGAGSSLKVDGATTNGSLSNQPGSTQILPVAYALVGSVCEAIYFSGALSAPNITALSTSQRSYWGTP